MAIAIVADFSSFINSVVQKCMDCDIVMTKGILFTYMMSVSSVKFLCLSIIFVGSSCIVVTMLEDFLHVVLPCNDPMFGIMFCWCT